MKRALVLSGGGAKGAFQAGALRFIYEEVLRNKHYVFDVIAGVSVGSLNGAMLAMGRLPKLLDLWNNIKQSDVYSGKLKPLPAIWRIILGKRSVLTNDPLFHLIQEIISKDDIKSGCDFRVGTVSLVSGKYESVTVKDCDTEEDAHKVILASTSIPIIWPPVSQVSVNENSGKYQELIDGGLRNVSPLGDIIDDDPDEVYIINCQEPELHRNPNAGNNIFTIASRSLIDIALNEIFRSDIREFLRINQLVQQADEHNVVLTNSSGKPLKSYTSFYIEPKENIGDTLDFSRDLLEKRIELGYAAAKKVFTESSPEFA